MGSICDGSESMAIIKNRNGAMYTVAAIIVVLITLIAIAEKNELHLRESFSSEEIRINTMNEFMKDVQKDLSRGISIASYRALLAILQAETEKGSFLNDVSGAFKEAFLNGSINKTGMPIIENATIINWTNRIKEQAAKIGIQSEFKINNLSIEQISPWEISVNSTVSINLLDEKNTASWNSIKNISVILNIIGIEDPVYIIGTYGRVSNIIAQNDFGLAPLQNLEKHINNSHYIPSTTAPSYLMRLQGDFSASENGIESIVNLNELSLQDLPLLQRSNVDYIYFGNDSHSSCQINQTKDGNYSFFRLDNGAEPLNHLENYGVSCVLS